MAEQVAAGAEKKGGGRAGVLRNNLVAHNT